MLMIFCALSEQIVMLRSLESLGIGICYNPVRSKEFTEVVFATFVPGLRKSKFHRF